MRKVFRKITIRTNILTNIIIVVALVAVALLLLQYYFSRKMALKATERTFKQIAEKVAVHLKADDRFIRTLLHQIALYPDIEKEPAEGGVEGNVRRFVKTMSRIDTIYAVYVGYANGDLFEVVNLRSAPHLLKKFRAPAGARWLVIRVVSAGGGRHRRVVFYDMGMRFLAEREEPTRYDARARPWYTLALKHNGTVRSPPYLFSFLGRRGVTYSLAIGPPRAVVAIDFTLKQFSDFLKKQVFAPTAGVYLFDKTGKVIASSNGRKDVFSRFFVSSENVTPNEVFLRSFKGVARYLMVTSFPGKWGWGDFLGFSVDADVMLKSYRKGIIYAFGAAFVALMLSIPLIFFTTSKIVRPIKALMRENEKIKGRRFDEVRPVETHIIELMELSDSLISMSRSIQEYEKSLETMIDSFVKLIAGAIDTKSPYTGGHCKRVPVIALELAKAVDASEDGEFAAFHFETEGEWKAFEMGAWLHDCGKITTPEFVVDKATKLETVYNRIHEIRTRFEVLWRDIEIRYYERLLSGEEKKSLEEWKETEHRRLLEAFSFVAACNVGDVPMDEENKARLRRIAQRTWTRHFSNRLGISEIERQRFKDEEPPLPVEEPLLSDRPEHLVPRTGFDDKAYRERGFRLEVPENLYNFGELYNLSIGRGTLNREDIYKIREHVIMTIEMLEQLPYPEDLKRIPEYAGTHHETLDGSGYPRKLTKDELPIPSRIMAIADIFEALTASDRPYKNGKPLSEALKIMAFMVKDGHLDAALFTLFVRSGIYRDYAEEYLRPEQIDPVDEEILLDGMAQSTT